MKVTTFYKPQSKSLKKCLIIKKMLEYHLIKIQGKNTSGSTFCSNISSASMSPESPASPEVDSIGEIEGNYSF
jgi:hypothetical protein